MGDCLKSLRKETTISKKGGLIHLSLSFNCRKLVSSSKSLSLVLTRTNGRATPNEVRVETTGQITDEKGEYGKLFDKLRAIAQKTHLRDQKDEMRTLTSLGQELSEMI